MQAAFVEWVRWNRAQTPLLRLGFSIPNGARMSPSVAKTMKAEGMEPGVPDWMLPVRCGNSSGLAIEFKAPGRKPTDEQSRFAAMLVEQRWFYRLCYSVDDAIDVVSRYLRL